MSKLNTGLTRVLSASVLIFAGAAWRADESEELSKRVEALESELQDVNAYLQAQAKSAQSFEKALGSVEAGGFTYGINGDSRKELLAALRSDLKARAKSVPGTPEPKEEEPKRGRRSRR